MKPAKTLVYIGWTFICFGAALLASDLGPAVYLIAAGLVLFPIGAAELG